MARYLHHVRQGELSEHTRDMQANANARALGPFVGVHAGFCDPELADGPGVTSAYTGFSADGRWYEHGRPVTSSVGEVLGNAQHDLNGRKWRLAIATMPWSQTETALVLAPATGASTVFDARGRFELRGDFHVRLRVASTDMAPGLNDGPSQDNAVWFGVRAITGGASALIKHTRNASLDNADGFAAEISGVGTMVGYTAQAVASDAPIELIARRVSGILHLQFMVGAGVVTEVWAGALAGRVAVEFGARSADAAAPNWQAVMAEFIHVSGWTNYSSLATWATERARGAEFDEFVGDELGELWTEEISLGGMVTCGAGDDGRGLRLKSLNGGTARAATPTITGDFSVRIVANTTRGPTDAPQIGAVDKLLAVEVHPAWTNGNDPVLTVAIESEMVDGGGLMPDSIVVRPVLHYDDGVGGPVTLATGEPWGSPEPGVVCTFERRGRTCIVAVEDTHSGERLLTFTTDDDVLPTAPLHIGLAAVGENTSADFATEIRSVRITSPHSLRLDAWPGDHYGGGALAATTEVSRYAGKDAYPALGQLTMIGLVDRAPFWRMVGCWNNETGQGAQALPGGTVGDVWADPQAGRLIVPVAHTTDAGFIIVDLAADTIYLQRGADLLTFNGPVGWRHFGLGYEATTDGSADRPPDGLALGYDEMEAGGTLTGDLHVWTTTKAVRIFATDTGQAAEVMRDNDPGADGETMIFRTVAVAPPSPPDGNTAALVVLTRRRNDIAVAVYRDATAHLGATEPTPGAWANAIYTGATPDALNVGFVAGKVIGDADMADGETPDMHAIRPTAAEAGGLPFFAVARPGGASVTQDDATPADALHNSWVALTPVQSIIIGGPGAPIDISGKVSGYGRAVRLTPDACSVVGARAGFVIFGFGQFGQIGSIGFYIGGFDAIPMHTMKVRTRVATTHIAPEFSLADPRASGQGLTLAYPPPGMVGGLRVYFGLSGAAGVGVVEYDLLAVTGGPWHGPHIGGSTLNIQGWGLDGVVGVYVGGVDCFRLSLDVRPEMPVLRAVNRALGFIAHPETGPIMSDDELTDTAAWPHDVLLRWRDGFELRMVGAFTYESAICIEHHLARIMGRLTPPVLDADPKADNPQRHLLVALAFLLCRMQTHFFDVLEAETYLPTAIGDGLRHLAGSYGAAAPFQGMSDAQVRAWVARRVGGHRVTPKAILDLLEPVLGVRPTMTEGFREFTVTVVNLPNQNVGAAMRNFWGDSTDADSATGGYFDRDFWGGDDPRIVSARRVLNWMRAAGVRANLILEDESP